MGDNQLALFDAIRRKEGYANSATIENALVSLAYQVGMTLEQIEDALFSERQLVIYEP